MNEDINLRIKFIHEVERHPFLYDHNHALYNHRDKIEAAWKKIGEKFGEESDHCKKKWRLIRCSYTRSLKTQIRQKAVPGIGLAKGYYMAPHLRFLDPFLKSRSFQDYNTLSEEEEEIIESNDGSNIVQVTLDNVKVERDGDDEEFEEQAAEQGEQVYEQVYEDASQDYTIDKRQREDNDNNTENSFKRFKLDIHDEPKEKRKEETRREEKRNLDPNEMYLLSLTPYLQDMTERQKLTFRKGVLELIENIKYGPKGTTTTKD